MKFKYIIYLLYILLILFIPLYFYSYNMEKTTIPNKYDVKILDSKYINTDISNNIQLRKNEDVKAVEEKEEVKEEKEKVKVDKVIKKETKIEEKKEVKKETVVKNTNPVVPSKTKNVSDVLETLTGKLTNYGPDCYGCSGRVSYGQDVTNGNIYYNDSKYGKVRIVAGDKKFKFGTIVRIKNSKSGNNIIAIVLDRGSNVGIGKATLFDLLYESNKAASKVGTSNNVTFEILRYGF